MHTVTISMVEYEGERFSIAYTSWKPKTFACQQALERTLDYIEGRYPPHYPVPALYGELFVATDRLQEWIELGKWAAANGFTVRDVT